MGQAMLKHCPVCGKESVEKYSPFCGARCANIDLGRWLGEKYVLQTDEKPQDSLPDLDDDQS